MSKTRGRYSSNSGIFAKRGDPWVSDREGVKDFGRNPETENAEFDFDHRFHNSGGTFGKPTVAPIREEVKEPRPVVSDEPDFLRRKAAILVKMHTDIRKNSETFVSIKDERESRNEGDPRVENYNARLTAVHKGRSLHGSTGSYFKGSQKISTRPRYLGRYSEIIETSKRSK